MQLYWSQCRALLFMNSLQPDYTHFYDKYNYLEFLFEMAKAWYNVSASSQQTFKYLISSPPSSFGCQSLFWGLSSGFARQFFFLVTVVVMVYGFRHTPP